LLHGILRLLYLQKIPENISKAESDEKKETKLIKTFDSPTTLELAYYNQPKKLQQNM